MYGSGACTCITGYTGTVCESCALGYVYIPSLLRCVHVPSPTCYDGLQNGDEGGADCGGSVCAPCPIVSTGQSWVQAHTTGIAIGLLVVCLTVLSISVAVGAAVLRRKRGRRSGSDPGASGRTYTNGRSGSKLSPQPSTSRDAQRAPGLELPGSDGHAAGDDDEGSRRRQGMAVAPVTAGSTTSPLPNGSEYPVTDSGAVTRSSAPASVLSAGDDVVDALFDRSRATSVAVDDVLGEVGAALDAVRAQDRLSSSSSRGSAAATSPDETGFASVRVTPDLEHAEGLVCLPPATMASQSTAASTDGYDDAVGDTDTDVCERSQLLVSRSGAAAVTAGYPTPSPMRPPVVATAAKSQSGLGVFVPSVPRPPSMTSPLLHTGQMSNDYWSGTAVLPEMSRYSASSASSAATTTFVDEDLDRFRGRDADGADRPRGSRRRARLPGTSRAPIAAPSTNLSLSARLEAMAVDCMVEDALQRYGRAHRVCVCVCGWVGKCVRSGLILRPLVRAHCFTA